MRAIFSGDYPTTQSLRKPSLQMHHVAEATLQLPNRPASNPGIIGLLHHGQAFLLRFLWGNQIRTSIHLSLLLRWGVGTQGHRTVHPGLFFYHVLEVTRVTSLGSTRLHPLSHLSNLANLSYCVLTHDVSPQSACSVMQGTPRRPLVGWPAALLGPPSKPTVPFPQLGLSHLKSPCELKSPSLKL